MKGLFLFNSPPFRDPELGELVRSRGQWRGLFRFTAAADEPVPLLLSGTRKAPQHQTVAAARALTLQLAAWRPTIATALFEHYEPYAKAVAAGELPSSNVPFPDIASPAQVWPHVSLVFVAVAEQRGVPTTELGYATDWDAEHTLGVRFRSGQFIELCGSVMRP